MTNSSLAQNAINNVIYKGFSSIGTNGFNTSLYGIALVNRDLQNAFSTKLRTRVRRANFGSIIWDKFFDLYDSNSQTEIYNSIVTICQEDPRVALLDSQIIANDTSITVKVLLNYVEFDMTQASWLDFVFNY